MNEVGLNGKFRQLQLRYQAIGWVPQRKNAVISRLMDAGKFIYAKVASKELVEEDEWVDMRMKIYMRDV